MNHDLLFDCLASFELSDGEYGEIEALEQRVRAYLDRVIENVD